MMKTMASLAYLLLWLTLTATAQTKSRHQCPMVKIQPERLPDLPMARASHATFCSNGEIVVVGGHTDGFVPTATADYSLELHNPYVRKGNIRNCEALNTLCRF